MLLSLIKSISTQMSIKLVNKWCQQHAEKPNSLQKASMLQQSISTLGVENPAGITLHIPTARWHGLSAAWVRSRGVRRLKGIAAYCYIGCISAYHMRARMKNGQELRGERQMKGGGGVRREERDIWDWGGGVGEKGDKKRDQVKFEGRGWNVWGRRS